MKKWQWLEDAIAALLKEAAILNEKSTLVDIVDMSVQMECIEMNLMTAGMECSPELRKEIRRIRTIRNKLL